MISLKQDRMIILFFLLPNDFKYDFLAPPSLSASNYPVVSGQGGCKIKWQRPYSPCWVFLYCTISWYRGWTLQMTYYNLPSPANKAKWYIFFLLADIPVISKIFKPGYFSGYSGDPCENAYHLALTCSRSEANSLHPLFSLCKWNLLQAIPCERQAPFFASTNSREHMPGWRHLLYTSIGRPMHFCSQPSFGKGIGSVLVKCLSPF